MLTGNYGSFKQNKQYYNISIIYILQPHYNNTLTLFNIDDSRFQQLRNELIIFFFLSYFILNISRKTNRRFYFTLNPAMQAFQANHQTIQKPTLSVEQ